MPECPGRRKISLHVESTPLLWRGFSFLVAPAWSCEHPLLVGHPGGRAAAHLP